ncbi:unnamed protein product [Brassica napus]|uniref:40S ribosomal protein S12 n=1 Tax=Brassica napus TaxID=3708 RepID=A0A816UZF2_BRANA|nr:unnamed protein product [Brassica napus]
MEFRSDLYGGLSKVAELLGVGRVGMSHQAGSDSLVTSRVFMKMKERDCMDNYCGVFCFPISSLSFPLQPSSSSSREQRLKFFFRNFILRHNMSGDEAAAPVVVPPVAEPAAIPEDMDLLTALELTLRKARAHGGVVRGLHESAKLIEKRVAQLCVLAEDCNQPDYVKLVKALCADHNINLLTVPSAKTLGEWAGLCKIDSEGNARKVVGCSCLVVKDYGEDTTALNIVKKHIESN